jgi:iron complex transport system permease protein
VNRSVRVALWGLLLVGVVVVAPLVGPGHVAWRTVLDPAGSDAAAVILWKIRVPRVIAALLAGIGLSLGGAAFQALFRNPLATPYTLGVASGASFGVALATRLGLAAMVGGNLTPAAAFAGALLAIGVVWVLTEYRPDFSSTVLLLAGVAMSFFFSSLILFFQYTVSIGDSYRIVRWLMGGLAAVDGATVWRMTPFVVVGGAVVMALARPLDLLSLGSDVAASRGVSVEASQRWLFFGASLMVGGIVSACGPIGFVGMMAPHVARRLVGPGHRILLPASALLGGAFLVVCDTVARTVMAPMELPVGVITAFVGGPFFLWLLLHRGGPRRG